MPSLELVSTLPTGAGAGAPAAARSCGRGFGALTRTAAAAVGAVPPLRRAAGGAAKARETKEKAAATLAEKTGAPYTGITDTKLRRLIRNWHRTAYGCARAAFRRATKKRRSGMDPDEAEADDEKDVPEDSSMRKG